MFQWLIDVIKNWFLDRQITKAARAIYRYDSALVVALKLYRQGLPFMAIIEAYSAATSNLDDDKIVADLMTRPFNQVLPGLANVIGTIPIFFGDDINKICTRIVDKILEQRS